MEREGEAQEKMDIQHQDGRESVKCIHLSVLYISLSMHHIQHTPGGYVWQKLFYGAETRTITKSLLSRVDAFDCGYIAQY